MHLSQTKLHTGRDIRSLKPSDKPYRFGNGLYLWVTPAGTRSWQVRYRDLDGKAQATMIGRLPAMTLTLAERRRLEALNSLKFSRALVKLNS